MKKIAIPAMTALGCSLTACTPSDGTDTGEVKEPSSEPSGEPSGEPSDEPVEVGDISEVIGLWDVNSYTMSYYGYSYGYTFPTTEVEESDSYGATISYSETITLFMDIAESGDMSLIQSYAITESLSIDGNEIYSIDVSYSYSYGTIGQIRQSDNSYAVQLDDLPDLSCTLTSEVLDCFKEEEDDDFSIEFTISKNATGIPEDSENIVDNFPETPQYEKTECIDATITTTGNSLEWGGFEDVEDDVHLFCEEEGYEYYGYSYGQPNADDLVFTFQAPNDGCFTFNTTGTNFDHGIQLIDSCDAIEALDCTLTSNSIERGMTAGEEVLVVIDGASDIEQVFNLSINEISFDTASFDVLPSDTSALDTTAWTESFESTCGSIGNAKSFLWTAPSTGTVSIDLAGSTFDTVVSVKENVCGAAAECNDDNYNSYDSLQSFLELPVEEGKEYVISVGGFGSDSGILSMSLTVTE